jgi:hypothetical protein
MVELVCVGQWLVDDITVVKKGRNIGCFELQTVEPLSRIPDGNSKTYWIGFKNLGCKTWLRRSEIIKSVILRHEPLKVLLVLHPVQSKCRWSNRCTDHLCRSGWYLVRNELSEKASKVAFLVFYYYVVHSVVNDLPIFVATKQVLRIKLGNRNGPLTLNFI